MNFNCVTSHAPISVRYSARSRSTRGVSRSEAWSDFFQWQHQTLQLAANRRARDLRTFGFRNLIRKLLKRRVRLLGDSVPQCFRMVSKSAPLSSGVWLSGVTAGCLPLTPEFFNEGQADCKAICYIALRFFLRFERLNDLFT
jgi:hypothetical protein